MELPCHEEHRPVDGLHSVGYTETSYTRHLKTVISNMQKGNAAHARHAKPAAETPTRKSAQSSPSTLVQDKKRTSGSGQGKKKSSGPWLVVFVVALVVLIGSLVALGAIALSYSQGQQKYEKVAEHINFNAAEITQADQVVLDELVVDWDALLAANEDTVAWVYIPGTGVNYPVVQARDNDYYLTVDFDGVAGWLANYGAIFLDYRNAPDFSDEASFIYGHHMQDGSMFAVIADMRDQQLFDDHRTVYLLTPGGNYKLRTFALVHCDGNENLIQTDFDSDAERTAYLVDKIDRSVVDVPDAPDAADIDRVIVLATCDDYGSGRYILYCYIEETTANGLSGDVGLSVEGGETTGLRDDLKVTDATATQEKTQNTR